MSLVVAAALIWPQIPALDSFPKLRRLEYSYNQVGYWAADRRNPPKHTRTCTHPYTNMRACVRHVIGLFAYACCHACHACVQIKSLVPLEALQAPQLKELYVAANKVGGRRGWGGGGCWAASAVERRGKEGANCQGTGRYSGGWVGAG